MEDDVITEWAADPLLFCREVFSSPNVPWQDEAFSDLILHNKLAIRSGHGVGKSNFLARAAYWFLCTRIPTKIVATAPSKHQLDDILIPEFVKLRREMIPEIGNNIVIKDSERKVCLVNAENEAFIVFRTVRREVPEALQGFHEENMMILVDEASGVPDEIFIVGEGSLSTWGFYAILASNPTRRKGFFADIFFKETSVRQWARRKVSCRDSPLVSGDYPLYMLDKYGQDSDIYRVRVLGEFPNSDEDSYIPDFMVLRAINNEVEEDSMYEIWGLDVARMGSNKSVLTKRKGRNLKSIHKWTHMDAMQLSGVITYEYNNALDKPMSICIDIIGPGSGVYDRLFHAGIPVVGVNSSSSSMFPETHVNLRMDLWYLMKQWFEGNVSIIEDLELKEQLPSVKYKYTMTGKMRMYSKEEMRSDGIASPDCADSFSLTFAENDVINESEIPVVPGSQHWKLGKKGKRISWMGV